MRIRYVILYILGVAFSAFASALHFAPCSDCPIHGPPSSPPPRPPSSPSSSTSSSPFTLGSSSSSSSLSPSSSPSPTTSSTTSTSPSSTPAPAPACPPAPTSTCSPTNQVIIDIQTIDKYLRKCNATYNAFGVNEAPTSKQESAALSCNDDLNTAIKKLTSDANKSTTFTSCQSAYIANYLKGILTCDIISVLNNIEAHYPGIRKGSLTSVFESQLKSQLQLVQGLGSAITAKFVEPYKSQAPAVVKVITDKYNEAIKKFAS